MHIRMGGSRGGAGGSDPLKNHNTIGLQPYWPGSPEKSQVYKASIQCWAINGTTVKLHFNGVCWRADVGPLMVVFGSSLPSSTKKKTLSKSDPLWQNFLDSCKMRDLV